VSGDFEWSRKEAVGAYFKVLSRHLSVTEEENGKPKSGLSVPIPRQDPGKYQALNRPVRRCDRESQSPSPQIEEWSQY
jgi:hypothetical protein